MAWPDTPCHGDVFHIIQQGKSLATLWHRVASGARTGREQLEARLANPRRRGEDSLLEAALETLRRNEAHAHELAADPRTLVQWLERDILSLAGPDLATRQRLFDFVVAELQQREAREVKRYRDAEMAVRWGAAGFLEAEKNFRKILGVSELWVLATALKRPPSKSNIDHDRKVA